MHWNRPGQEPIAFNGIIPWQPESPNSDMDASGLQDYPFFLLQKTRWVDSSHLDAKHMVSATTTSVIDDEIENNNRSFLLSLPLEIRLQIYHWVYLMHKIKPRNMTPWHLYPSPVAYFVKPAQQSSNHSTGDEPNGAPADEEKQIRKRNVTAAQDLLDPYRPYGRLPTDLLVSNRQIYLEARDIPFRHNEFVFNNWYSSGLWTALTCLRKLETWQRDDLRFVRLELLARDLSGAHDDALGGLCDFLGQGLRGLRLKIVSFGVTCASSVTALPPRNWAFPGVAETEGNRIESMALVRNQKTGETMRWIREGLARMKSLKWLQVELSDYSCDAKTKIQWCEQLETTLNEARKEMTVKDGENTEPVQVLCVERDTHRRQGS